MCGVWCVSKTTTFSAIPQCFFLFFFNLCRLIASRMVITVNCESYIVIYTHSCALYEIAFIGCLDAFFEKLPVEALEMAALFSASRTDLFVLTEGRAPKPHMLKPVPDM